MKFFRNIFSIVLFMFVSTPAFSNPDPFLPPPTDDDPQDLPIDNLVWVVAGLGALYAFYTHKNTVSSKLKTKP